MYDLARFSLSDMTRFGAQLRRLGEGASSMEDVAGRVVRSFYDELRDPAGEPCCALVRLFVTVPFGQLSGEQQSFARKLVPELDTQPRVKCLTLLASAGQEQRWNSRTTSAGHQALPLTSEESVGRSPMIAQLMRQLGVDLGHLLAGDTSLVVDAGQHSFNVFYVPRAAGSPHIPAQDEFVIPYSVQSVLGFGGLVPPGELFAMILFTRTPVPRNVADLFKTLALNIKVALLPFAETRVFS